MKTNTDETLLHYQCIARRMRSLPDKCKNKKKFWVAIRSNLLHFRCLACWVVEFNYKRPFNTLW